MNDPQKVFQRLLELKGELKKLKAFMKERYNENSQYVEFTEKINELKKQRKEIQKQIDDMNPSEVTKIQDMKIDIASEQELLNDIILAKITKGETVELQDNFEQQVLPIFSVKFVSEK